MYRLKFEIPAGLNESECRTLRVYLLRRFATEASAQNAIDRMDFINIKIDAEIVDMSENDNAH